MRTIKRLAGPLGLALLGLVLSIAPAFSTTYYVRWDGSNDSTGTVNAGVGTANCAWATLSKANATADSGDVIRVISLAPADTTGADTSHIIRPVRNGTATAYITYIGNPDSALVRGTSGISLSKKYISVKGFRSRGGINLEYVSELSKPVGDSVSYCHAQTMAFLCAKNSYVVNNTFRNTGANKTIVFLSANYVAGPPYHPITNPQGPPASQVVGDNYRVVFRNNVVDGGTISNPGQDKFFYMRYAHEDTVMNNQFTVLFGGSNGDCQGRYIYNSQDCRFEGNKWTFNATGEEPGDQWNAFAMRDSAADIWFVRDTMYCNLDSASTRAVGGRIINTGNAGWTAASRDNHWIDCVYRMSGHAWAQAIVDGFEFRGSIFHSLSSRALQLSTGNGMSIHHCTFKGKNDGALGQSFGFVEATGFSNSSVTNSIFYGDSSLAPGLGGGGNFYERGLAYFNTYSASNLINYNLYYAPRDRSGGAGYQHAVAAPGNYGNRIGPASSWCTADLHDCQSVWGSPLLADSTDAGFDPRPLSGSYAVSASFPGGYAGAIAPTDTIAPDSCHAYITKVFRLDQADQHWRGFLVQFTSPGDNGAGGGPVDSLQIAANFYLTDTVSPEAATFGSYRVTSSGVSASSIYLGTMGAIWPELVPGTPGETYSALILFNYATLAVNCEVPAPDDDLIVRVTVKAKDRAGNASYGRGYVNGCE